ncbi:hypothetical protein GLW03_11115 [Halobacillus halophilus]|uniref:hypothetical protein n=1 Tax=Halobacillus halophilus TaxID=1570 RepID=UPI00136DDD30|nr:hypothetical protein [Halobacillus halophilus]MYL30372.1 hypothetical protein [Halobacillus halophilus]
MPIIIPNLLSSLAPLSVEATFNSDLLINVFIRKAEIKADPKPIILTKLMNIFRLKNIVIDNIINNKKPYPKAFLNVTPLSLF